MGNFFKTLTSMKMMSILILIFAVATATATFIENDYGTDSAKVLIYNAKWFEFLLIFITLNLVVNIFRFKLYKREKFAIFAFHLAFLFILIGSGLTRYVGYEGTMPIREGASSSNMISSDSYFQVKIFDGEKVYYSEDKLLLAELGSHEFSQKLAIKDKKIDIDLIEFIPNAVNSIVEDKENGKPILSLMISTGDAPEAIFLKADNQESVNGINFCFNQGCEGVEIKIEEKELFFKINEEIDSFSMDTRESNRLSANEFHKLERRYLYSNDTTQFVLKNFYESASIQLIAGERARGGTIDAFKFKFTVNEKTKDVTLFGKNGELGTDVGFGLDGLKFDVNYGSKYIKLPFAIKLKDFQLERYAGSMSPSSYASEVRVLDGDYSFDFRIYMNHILEHKGFRFYQASYDQDEGGTILSVNHDYFGTLITYFGYWMLGIGMFLALLAPKGRFAQLRKKLSKIQKDKSSLVAILLTVLMLSFSPNLSANTDTKINTEDILKIIQSFDKTHADKFSELLVQDVTGRIKPINTLSTEILNKLSRKSEFYGLSANQIFLGMTVKPAEWQVVKLIKVNNSKVNEVLGVDKSEKYLAFVDFFDEITGYKLLTYVEEATRKRPAFRDKFDKEVLKIDERVSISYMIYTGDLLKVFPKPNDKDSSWYSPMEAMKSFSKEDIQSVKTLTRDYFESIDLAISTNDWSKVDENLEKIVEFQQFYGASIILNDSKIKAEILYNDLNIFQNLIPFYGIIGLILLVLSFIHILNQKLNIERVTQIAKYLLLGGFVIHTFGLALRWYVSGHAPWSDGYESMIYISWATILAGTIFAKKSSMTISATVILSTLILFVAHLSWMDPQISNLVPVLKSYWLTIHVSMITASYGFLGLGAILGFINLILFILRKNNKFLDLSIKELTYISEMGLIVGIILLTIGNFLGGVWANESWGRYWGWDPKETWTLVTILVYVFIVHMRFIPKLNSIYAFNVASLIGFSSVIMTYFGVNFYLSGLHSYAKGDPVPIPDFVYYTIIITFTIIALAYPKRNLK